MLRLDYCAAVQPLNEYLLPRYVNSLVPITVVLRLYCSHISPLWAFLDFSSHISPFTAPPKWPPAIFFHTNHMLTAPMIDRLLCSRVDELDQTKLGIHSLDV
jgi:hypothetical protein